ncbi:MAG: TetR/AcrR family transcriptional regulator [Aeriscardovia sp.]|nr:TetR/AcrR family transcriptional regulator [Aeriscardovia sp.]
MAGSRKDYNRAETQRHIKKVFLELYDRGGIETITVNALCKEAGIVKSTFYTYFDDKYSVLEMIEQNLLSHLSYVNASLEDIDVAMVLRGEPLPQASKTVEFILDHLDEYRAIMGPHGDPSFEIRWRRNIAESFRNRFLKEKGDVRSAGLACAIFSSTLIGIYRYFIFEAPDISKEDFTMILGNTFKYALLDFQAST